MFKDIKALVAASFAGLLTKGHLLRISYTRDDIWNAYLQAFPEETRQEHNCNCCKNYICSAGTAVVVDRANDHAVRSVWDIPEDSLPEEYRASIVALRDYVRAQPIERLFFYTEPNMGTDRTPQTVNVLDGEGQPVMIKGAPKVRTIVWEHFHAATPPAAYDKLGKGDAKNGEVTSLLGVFKRGLETLTPESLEITLDLIEQNRLYRGPEFKDMLETFQAQQKFYLRLPEDQRTAYLWDTVANGRVWAAAAGIRNTIIGTMLQDLSEGKDINNALGAFEYKNAPANYQRPQAVVTPKMVAAAKERLTELGLISALDRKILGDRDLTAAHAIWTYRPTVKTKDAFAELAGEAPVSPKTLAGVEEVTIEKFLASFLPNAKSVQLLFERNHLMHLATLTGPVDPEAKSIMAWDNSFGWSYTGGTADAIKERVKLAGGRVDGWMRISLGWSNHDDLDLHFKGPAGLHIFHVSKRAPAFDAALDVDMNAGYGTTRTPVENVHVGRPLPAGKYAALVHQFSKRETSDTGFEVQIEVNGEVRHFGSNTSPANRSYAEPIEFIVDKDGGVAFADNKLSKHATGTVKWGLKTGSWHTVRAVTLSPNHWGEKPFGNKHLFFLLNGCVSDEKTRPFYNEFLTSELAKDRKVTEALAGKIEVLPAEGAELSGLGFSETIRNHAYFRVEGPRFTSTVKVLF